MARSYKLGIDVGGTFTDGTLLDETTGETFSAKVPSTPKDPSIAFLRSIDRIFSELEVDPVEVWLLVHGTTVATNCIIEQKTAKTALLVTKGFKDILEIAYQIRPKLYDIFVEKPVPLVPRNLVFEVCERIGSRGEVVAALDTKNVEEIAERLEEEAVEAVAVCYLHSYVNGRHEELTKEILQKRLPGVSTTVSCEVCSEFREYPRASTTVINSCVKPIVSKYLGKIERGLQDQGFQCGCYVMQSNGGIVHSRLAKEQPGRIIESGPAAGVIMCNYLATQAGIQQCISLDMGGTTAKVGMILDGKPRRTPELEVGAAAFSRSTAQRGVGYPLKTASIDLVEIGAGGGSIAWVDDGGILRVGPESAGADPGPACYPDGGERPTITDANVVLGRLNPDYFLGGAMKLDSSRARKAIDEHCGGPLKKSTTHTAAGIIAVAMSSMVNAIRFLTVEKGYDPRDFALIAIGGAGPLHANLLIEELDMPQAIIPPSPGVASSLGLLVTDVKQEVSRTVIREEITSFQAIAEVIAELGSQVKGLLEEQGIDDEHITVAPSIDMRYAGQSYELNVELSPTRLDCITRDILDDLFHEEHQRAYGFCASEEHTEIVSVKVAGIGQIKKHEPKELRTGDAQVRIESRKGLRKVYFGQLGQSVECSVYDRMKLLAQDVVKGPAIIEEVDSTTVILPGFRGKVGRFGDVVISRSVKSR